MFEFMSAVLGWLQSIANFVIGLIENLILAIVAIAHSSALPLVIVGHMPMIIGASVSIVIAIMAAKFIIGR